MGDIQEMKAIAGFRQLPHYLREQYKSHVINMGAAGALELAGNYPLSRMTSSPHH